jgi:hypothetical protein
LLRRGAGSRWTCSLTTYPPGRRGENVERSRSYRTVTTPGVSGRHTHSTTLGERFALMKVGNGVYIHIGPVVANSDAPYSTLEFLRLAAKAEVKKDAGSRMSFGFGPLPGLEDIKRGGVAGYPDGSTTPPVGFRGLGPRGEAPDSQQVRYGPRPGTFTLPGHGQDLRPRGKNPLSPKRSTCTPPQT